VTGVSTAHLVLIGMMGSGKSSAAEGVAAARSMAWCDLDAEIERRAGRSVREIFATDGEAGFRDLERAVLAEALASATPTVIAAGGGIVVTPESRLLLRGTACVYLRANASTLLRRLEDAEDRPLLDGDRVAIVNGLLETRSPLYDEVATAVVDVDDLDLAATVAAICATVEASC
jgi:shikimate kinase